MRNKLYCDACFVEITGAQAKIFENHLIKDKDEWIYACKDCMRRIEEENMSKIIPETLHCNRCKSKLKKDEQNQFHIMKPGNIYQRVCGRCWDVVNMYTVAMEKIDDAKNEIEAYKDYYFDQLNKNELQAVNPCCDYITEKEDGIDPKDFYSICGRCVKELHQEPRTHECMSCQKEVYELEELMFSDRDDMKYCFESLNGPCKWVPNANKGPVTVYVCKDCAWKLIIFKDRD